MQPVTTKTIHKWSIMMAVAYALVIAVGITLAREDGSVFLGTLMGVMSLVAGYIMIFPMLWLLNGSVKFMAPVGALYSTLAIYENRVAIKRLDRNLQEKTEFYPLEDFEGICVAVNPISLWLGMMPAEKFAHGLIPVKVSPDFRRHTYSWIFLKRKNSQDNFAVMAKLSLGSFWRVLLSNRDARSRGLYTFNGKLDFAQDLSRRTGLPFLGVYEAAQ